MADTQNPQNIAAGAALVFLVDESSAMETRVAGGTKSKADSLATAINRTLNGLTAGPQVDVALVGYRTSPQGTLDLACRWDGPLTGRQFVSTGQLAETPLLIEDRVRRIPAAGGMGPVRQETVKFPIWYVPVLGGAAPAGPALTFCQSLLGAWTAKSGDRTKPPLVIHFVSDQADADESLAGQGPTPTPDSPLLLHAHLASSDRIPPVLFPSSDAHLPPGHVRRLFGLSSVLSPELANALRAVQVTVMAGARGLIYDARMADLIRLMAIVKAYAEYQPQPDRPAVEDQRQPGEPLTVVTEETVLEAGRSRQVSTVGAHPVGGETAGRHGPQLEETPADSVRVTSGGSSGAGQEETAPSGYPQGSATAGRPAVLLTLLLDRSVADTSEAKEKSVWHHLQEQANDVLAEIAKRPSGQMSVSVVSYGAGAGGQTEIQTVFPDPAAESPFVRDEELAGSALRVDEVLEKVPNGIGGLVEFTRKKPVFIDLPPATSGPPQAAFAAVKDLLDDWARQCGKSAPAPIVLHFTRGRFPPTELDQAVSELRQAQMGDVLLYHVVSTEYVHRSVSYPADPGKMDTPQLVALWEVTSPLLGRRQLATHSPAVTADSRGMVINGKFDMLLDCVATLFTP